jgi:uncharacterized protein YaeQ
MGASCLRVPGSLFRFQVRASNASEYSNQEPGTRTLEREWCSLQCMPHGSKLNATRQRLRPADRRLWVLIHSMAQTATIYAVTIDLADMDRGVYETLDLRVARHPSETAEYMLVRILAYCLEYEEGIEMTEGVSSGDDPALLVRDLTGRVTAWIEVGMPDAARLHRGSKHAGRVAVYTHRDARQLLAQLAGEKIHRGAEIPIRAFDRGLVEEAASLIERRTSLALSVSGGHLHLSFDNRTIEIPMIEHRIVTP